MRGSQIIIFQVFQHLIISVRKFILCLDQDTYYSAIKKFDRQTHEAHKGAAGKCVGVLGFPINAN